MTAAAILAHETIGGGAQRVIVMGGWLGDRGVFQPIHNWLDREQFTYCFVDPRGYGGSREIAGQHTNAEVAADLAVTEKTVKNVLLPVPFKVGVEDRGGSLRVRLTLRAHGIDF